MKICFIELLPFPNNIGGGTSHIKGLANEFLKKGIEVTVISSKAKDKIVLERNLSRLEVVQLGLNYKRSADFKGVMKIWYFIWRFLYISLFVLKSAIYLRKREFDFINAQSPIESALACFFS